MITQRSRSRHRFLRRSTTMLAMLVPMVLLPVVAFADRPAAWEEADSASTWGYLLLLVIIPLGISAVLAILTYLPSLIRGRADKWDTSWRYQQQ